MARERVSDSFVLNGQPVVGATIEVFDFGTTTPVAQTLYAAATGGTLFNGVTDPAGRFELYVATGARFSIRVTHPDITTATLTYESTPDPADVIKTSGSQARATGLTTDQQILDSPTINDAIFVGPSLTNPTLDGGSWTNATLTTPTVNGAAAFGGAVTVAGDETVEGVFRAKGATGSVKRGLKVQADGSISIGDFADSATGYGFEVLAMSRNTPSGTHGVGGVVSEAPITLAFYNRIAAADSAGITYTVSEGWRGNPGLAAAPGEASVLITGEWRLDLAKDTNIAAGYHGTRAVGGFGMNTETQATVLADGTNAVDQVGLKVESGGVFQGTDRLGNPKSTAGIRAGSALWLSHGQNGWWHLIVCTKLGAGVTTTPIVPAFAVTKEGWVGSNVWATARFHGKWESGTDAANAAIAIMESDSSAAIPTQYVARGLTATNKKATFGFNTTSNFAAVDALNNVTGVPLLLNPSLGAVIIGPDTGINGATGSRFFFKQSSDSIGGGLTVAKTGVGNQDNVHIWAGTGTANFTAWLPGTGTKTLTLTSTGTLLIDSVQLLSTRGAAVADLAVSVGTADGTIADVGAAFNQTTLNNNFRDIADKLNTLLARLRPTAGHGLIAA